MITNDYLNKVCEDLDSISNEHEKFTYVADLSNNLRVLKSEEFNENTKVSGCISETYVKASVTGGKVRIVGNSDSIIVKGLIALISNAFTGMEPSDFISNSETDLDGFLDKTKLNYSLTPSRANSFYSIYNHIKEDIKNSIDV